MDRALVAELFDALETAGRAAKVRRTVRELTVIRRWEYAPSVRLEVGYFGWYARDEWGPGSDLDLVLIAGEDSPFETRGARRDLTRLPVPAEALVYTPAEWEAVLGRGDRFASVLQRELVRIVEPLTPPAARTTGTRRSGTSRSP